MADDINVNMIADQLAKKVDLPDNKGQDGIDYVVEWKAPTASDPTWYRVYKSGWIEQGGRVPSTANNLTVTNFPKEFKDINYNIMVTCIDADGYGCATTKTTKSAIVAVSGGNKFRDWKAVGQGANQ